MTVSALATAPLAILPGALPFWAVELCLLLLATGLGPLFPLSNVAIQCAVPLHALGTTTALVTFMRSLGASLGVAIIGTVVVAGVTAAGFTGADALSGHAAAAGLALAPTYGLVFLVCGVSFALSAIWIGLIREPEFDRAEGAASVVMAD